MIWICIALILAIPAWLGLVRPGEAAPRRFIGRSLIVGVILGALFSVALFLTSPHVPLGRNLLYPPLLGGAACTLLGLSIGLPWMFFARSRRAHKSPTTGN